VGAAVLPSSVTAVHVHAGAAGTNGRVLFTLPLGPAYQSILGTITSAGTGTTYSGETPYAELFDLLGRDPTYLDVHTTRFPGGQLRGQLRLVHKDLDWVRRRCS
jgi:hypothetical protein